MNSERKRETSMALGKNRNYTLSVIKKQAKALLVLLVLFAGIQSVSAQENFQWGLKAGINASTQSELGNLFDNDNLLVGFNGGLVARYQFNDWLGVRSGIDFQQKGTQCDLLESDADTYNRLNYMVLPLKAEFSASEKAGFKKGQRMFFATGPYGGYLLDANQITGDVKTSLDNYNNFDFGWAFELGFEFPILETKALGFSLNYDMGISKVVDETDFRNKSASLNAIFLF